MALADLLQAHTANILRDDGVGAADAYGNLQSTWQTIHTAVPFRFELHNAWEERLGRLVNVATWRAYTLPDTDIRVSDRLYWVEEAKTFEVTGLEPVAGRTATHHIFCRLEVVE